MSVIIKILKNIAKSIGIFLFFFGLFAVVQLNYVEKITAPGGDLNNFINKSANQVFMEKCTNEGISETDCQIAFNQEYPKLTSEIMSKTSPIVKANSYSKKYVPYAYVSIILGALLIFLGVGLKLKLLRVFGSESLSIGVFTFINLYVTKVFLLPKLSATIPSGNNLQIGDLVQNFVYTNIFPYQIFIAKIFLLSGIVLLILYFSLEKLLNKTTKTSTLQSKESNI